MSDSWSPSSSPNNNNNNNNKFMSSRNSSTSSSSSSNARARGAARRASRRASRALYISANSVRGIAAAAAADDDDTTNNNNNNNNNSPSLGTGSNLLRRSVPMTVGEDEEVKEEVTELGSSGVMNNNNIDRPVLEREESWMADLRRQMGNNEVNSSHLQDMLGGTYTEFTSNHNSNNNITNNNNSNSSNMSNNTKEDSFSNYMGGGSGTVSTNLLTDTSDMMVSTSSLQQNAENGGFANSEILEQYKIMASHQARACVKATTGLDPGDIEKRRKMNNDDPTTTTNNPFVGIAGYSGPKGSASTILKMREGRAPPGPKPVEMASFVSEDFLSSLGKSWSSRHRLFQDVGSSYKTSERVPELCPGVMVDESGAYIEGDEHMVVCIACSKKMKVKRAAGLASCPGCYTVSPASSIRV